MGQTRSQFAIRSHKRARVLARRLRSFLRPGAGEATALRRELAETRRRLAHRKEDAERWKEDAERWQQDAMRLQHDFLRGALTPGPSSRPASTAGEASLYLDLMKRTLSGWVYADGNILDVGRSGLELRGEGGDWRSFNPRLREQGADWPEHAQTMIGLERLDNLQSCVEDALANDVPGDLIETGVWRGGATILMRAVLKAYGVEDRRVWVADSFEGVPPPDPERYPPDKDSPLHAFEELAVSLEQVKANFERYGLLDEQVRFLEGWFCDTLPEAPIERLAVVRLDGDMYESTMDALVNLYPKLSAGGYLIVDDYGALPMCRQAVHDYRTAHGISEEIRPIDWSGVFWRRADK